MIYRHISRCMIVVCLRSHDFLQHSSDDVLHDFLEEKSDNFGVVIRTELKQHGTRVSVEFVLFPSKFYVLYI